MRAVVAMIGALFALAAAASAQPDIRFTEVAEASGIRFINMYGGVRSKDFILETTGSGAAFFDYDGDADLDLFLVNGSRLGYDASQSLSNALFRNEGGGRFREVTGPAGLESYGWGQGAFVVDHENDGDLDLLVTRYGQNLFYRNRGDGTFEEVGEEVGLADPQWGTGAAFGDLDRDGVSDLVVVNYVDFLVEDTPRPGEEPYCFFRGLPVMCGPNGLTPAPALLYRGLPDGRFVRVEGQAIGAERYFGLGVVFGDLDEDGDLDVYVANDQTPNNFYRNDTAARGFDFTDVGLSAGIAYNEDGRAQAGMGVDLGDYDNDGRLDIVVTNFSHDYNTIYRAVGGGWFLDESFAAGVAEPSYPYLGWGTGFRDLDRDGWLDLVVLNGHVYPEVEGGITESDYAQRGLVFRNRTDGGFEEVPPTALEVPRVYRGAAFADYDDDGDTDLLATVMNGSPALFRNDTDTDAAWAGFRLVGRGSPRDGVGTRLELTGGGLTQVREARAAGSYLASSDPRVFFGLGDRDGPFRVRVRWLSGCEAEIEAAPGHYLLVVEPRDCGGS
ncbi:MAG: CRTAC1 family protein [Acidobacteria bacterium]|nr:CRTAC1 family protein [Acidobacteriota bacterium]